ncbi:glycan biosynthesis hexose transferase WsfD [Paenibacillus hodogayensis]
MPGLTFWTMVAAAAVMVYVLFVKPIVGIADNGDFLRIMTSAGLDYLDPNLSYEDKYFGNFIREFKMIPLGIGGYASTQVPLVIIATWLNKLTHSRDVFDMRYMAVVYGIMLLAAFWVASRYHRSLPLAGRIALAILLVVVFADVGYTGYFNSLFGEPVSFVFLLLTVAFALAAATREEPSRKLLIAFFVCAIFLTGSKVQNAPVGILIALLGLRFLGLRWDTAWRRTVIGFSAFLALGSLAMYVFAPKQLKEINMYQTVFYGVIKDSPTPEKDLEELGVSKELAILAGTNFFTPDTPIPQRDPRMYESFYDHMSHGKIALFYLKHPVRLIHKLEIAAQNGMTIRPYYLGTYEKSEGMSRGAVSEKFGLWSEWKRSLLPNSLWFLLPFYLVYYAVLWLEWRYAASLGGRIYTETFALIGLIGLVSFLIPVIGDGEADLSKHLFLFNVCFDLMFVASLIWIVAKVALLFGARRPTYVRYDGRW